MYKLYCSLPFSPVQKLWSIGTAYEQLRLITKKNEVSMATFPCIKPPPSPTIPPTKIHAKGMRCRGMGGRVKLLKTLGLLWICHWLSVTDNNVQPFRSPCDSFHREGQPVDRGTVLVFLPG